jgi:ABC-type phosphonate transport system ATPase subunit
MGADAAKKDLEWSIQEDHRVQTPVLKVENAAISYATRRGDVQAVRDVSFEIHRGEAFGIVRAGSYGDVLRMSCGTCAAIRSLWSIKIRCRHSILPCASATS